VTPREDRSGTTSMLRGKVAVVTGGSSGIGRAAALGLARQGAKVVVTGRRAAMLEEVAAEHPDISFLVADAARPEDASRTVAKAIDDWGRLDILVNNAGIQSVTSGDGFDRKTFDRILAVNLDGAVLCAREAIAHFLIRPGGGCAPVRPARFL